jgi:hypothetical protein
VDIRQALRTIIIEDATLAALVGTRVFGGKLPLRVTEPAIVFRLEETTDIPILDDPGVSNLTRSMFRFGAVSRGDQIQAYDISIDIDIALRDLLQGYRGLVSDGESPPRFMKIAGAWRHDAKDFYDDLTETYWVRSDWYIWHALA